MDSNEQNRINRIEEFLLDPEKTIFNSIEEFTEAAKILVDFLNNVNFDQLEMIQGQDGYTPVRGVDYFTPEDITAFETFLIERIPVEGVDYPTVQEVQDYISSQVAKIPRIKGDKGAKGEKGQDGKNGSPDTGIDIVRKLRAMTSKDGLKISDIKGLTPKIKLLNETVEEVEELRERVEDLKIVIPKLEEQGGGGDVNTVTGEDSISITGTATDRVVSLVNDEENPGNSKYYGTDSSGDKGYHDLPQGVGAVDSVNGQTGTVVLDTDDISEGLTNKYNVQSDWNASSGDAEIFNKPTLGTMSAESASDYTKTSDLGDLALKDQVSVPTDINASGTPSSSTYLRGDGSWATPSGGGGGTMNSFNIDADSGTQQTIDDGNTILFEGGTGIDTVVGATDKITIGLDSASQSSLGLADTAVQDLTDLGITASSSELNILDGVTTTTTEINYVNGVTSSIQTQLNAKADDSAVVKLTGDQTVAGVKTFTSFPVTPSSAPSTDYQTANKKYVDDGLDTKKNDPDPTVVASTASLTPNYNTTDKYQISALDETALALALPTNLPNGRAMSIGIIVADDTTFTPNGDYIFAEDNDAPETLETDKRYEFVIQRQGDDYFISYVSWIL